MRDEKRYVEFTIRGIAIDSRSQSPILLLQDTGRRLLLPIWIGPYEATAILSHLEGRIPERPMTHDLTTRIIGALEADVIGVDIRGLNAGTYLADLRLVTAAGAEIVLDCRPSDAIALAVRARATIRVEAAVLDAAQPLHEGPEPAPEASPQSLFVADDDAEGRARLAALLEDMDPEDFGEFET
jgi:bifunctional DNase/RNase